MDSKEWHGPAKVLGQDGQQVLVKNGSTYVRVHPCRLQLIQKGYETIQESNKQHNDITENRTQNSGTISKLCNDQYSNIETSDSEDENQDNNECNKNPFNEQVQIYQENPESYETESQPT